MELRGKGGAIQRYAILKMQLLSVNLGNGRLKQGIITLTACRTTGTAEDIPAE